MPSGGGGNNHRHRAGGLKQSNKRNKRSRASKRSLSRVAGGKVNHHNNNGGGGGGGGSSLLERQIQQSKSDRRNRQEQLRRNKREELLRKRRGLTIRNSTSSTSTSSIGIANGSSVTLPTTTTTPRVVGIICLSHSSSSSLSWDIEEHVRTFLIQGSDQQVRPHDTINERATVTVKYNVHKRNGLLTLLTCGTAFASQNNNNNNGMMMTTTTTTIAKEDSMVEEDDTPKSNVTNEHNHYQQQEQQQEEEDSHDVVLAALDLARIADLLVFVIDGNGSSSNNNNTTDPILDMKIGDMTTDGSCGSTKRTNTTWNTTKKKQQQQQEQQKWDHLISTQGDLILTALKAQGLPTTLTVLVHTESDPLDYYSSSAPRRRPPPMMMRMAVGPGDDDINNNNNNEEEMASIADHMTLHSVKSMRRHSVKRRLDLKKYIHRFATTEFGTGNDKVIEIDLSQSIATAGAATAAASITDSNHNNNHDKKNTAENSGNGQTIMKDDDDDHHHHPPPPLSQQQPPINTRQTLLLDTTTASVSSSALLLSSPNALIRTICTMSCTPSKWVSQSPRTYLLSDTYYYNPTCHELCLVGYLRGMAPLDIHGLIHVPNVGTFAPKSITRLEAPILHHQQRQRQQRRHSNNNNNNNRKKNKEHLNTMDNMADSIMEEEDDKNNNNNKDVLLADPEQQESLNMFATPDALAGEQNLIGFQNDEEEDGITTDMDNDDENNNSKDNNDDIVGLSRPAGWSDYQSAWLDAVDEDGNDDEDRDRGELANELNRKKTTNVAASVSPPPPPNVTSDGMTTTMMMMVDKDDDAELANDISISERQSLMEQRRRKEQHEHEEFPDEVQIGEDDKACERYARYRSLKSFKKSIWDPKENLPDSYATFYHFSNFKTTQRTVHKDWKETIRAAEHVNNNFFGKSPPPPPSTTTLLNDNDRNNNNNDSQEDVAMKDIDDTNVENDTNDNDNNEDDDYDPLEGCVPSGTYVSLTLGGVTEESYRSLSPKALLTAVSLLEHEHKVSVLHIGLCQSAKMAAAAAAASSSTTTTTTLGEEDEEEQESGGNTNNNTTNPIIKSKDVLTFRCGWRTWQARPIFSQNNLNCNKHKFERFLPTDGTYFAARIFGPVTYTPCPVLVFRQCEKEGKLLRQELVGAGTMMNADADRIVVKRIVLTGFPVRVHKRHATVKYMFYNPDDVRWFKPAELFTKHGLRGNIIESVGEHGTMKCLFNAPIKQHDTVCLALYKRIYPKYYVPPRPPPPPPRRIVDGTTSASADAAVVIVDDEDNNNNNTEQEETTRREALMSSEPSLLVVK